MFFVTHFRYNEQDKRTVSAILGENRKYQVETKEEE